MTTTNEKLLDSYLKVIADTYTKFIPLAAIWTPLSYKVVRNGEIEETRRIVPKDQLKLIHGVLCSCNDGLPTHEVVKLYGTAQNTEFKWELRNLATGEIETFKNL